MITNKEMLCTFFGALKFIEDIPNQYKTPIMIKLGKQQLGIEEKEVLEMLKEINETLDYMLKRALDSMHKMKSEELR